MWRSTLVAVEVKSETEGAPSSAVRRTQKSLTTLQSAYSGVGIGLLCSRCPLLGMQDIRHTCTLLAAGDDCNRICGVERVALIA
jgi:hypothetical protein